MGICFGAKEKKMNILAVSVCDAADKKCKDITEKDMRDETSSDKSHDVNDYLKKGGPVRAIVENKLCIVGKMGGNAKADIHLEVYPLNYADLNKKAKDLLDEAGIEEDDYDEHMELIC